LKQLSLLFFLSLQLLAFDTKTASKIFDKIFTAMLPKQSIIVYTPHKEYAEVIEMAPSLVLADTYTEADIILVDHLSDISPNNMQTIFTTNPSIFKRDERAVGAFYWEHGRPKIIFLQSRLDAKRMTLSKSFNRYIVKKLP